MSALVRLCCCAALIIGTLWPFGGAFAGATPWPEVPFKYFAQHYELSRVLHDFADIFGIRLDLSGQVSGQVSGEMTARTPTVFLDALSSSYGLDWYYQDGVLHVTKAVEWSNQVLHVGTAGRDVGVLKAELIRLGILEPRFGWAEFPERGIVMVAGPPDYVKEISAVIASLGTAPSDGRQIRIFRLKNARADDYMFSYHEQRVVTPGVATLLRDLAAGSIADQQAGPSHGPLSVAAAPTPVQSLPSLPILTGGAVAPDSAESPAPPATAAGKTAPAAADDPKVSVHTGRDFLTPVIEADPRLNAVIVYDAPERMPVYEALIQQLDARQPQIQIEAMIVDVDSESVDSLGVDWEAHVSDTSFGFGARNNQATILSINTNSFVAHLHALAAKGHARILGRPSIITVENLVAVLSLSETVYERISGSGGGRGGGVGTTAGLVPIVTGTTLKVIPRMLEEEGRRDISLAVEIEDGQIRQIPRNSDTLPTVSQSNINTQAVVHEDDALLIGGYFMDNDVDEQQRVPVLGSIPVVGALFRDRHDEHKRSERLFIIRPHLVPSPVPTASAATPGETTKAAAPGAAEKLADQR